MSPLVSMSSMSGDDLTSRDDRPTERIGPDDRPTWREMTEGQTVLGRFLLRRLLGRGGMGVVWLARDQSLGDEVALKFVSELLKRDAAAVDDLKSETRKARRLTHPHIVRIHEFWEDAQAAAVSMEFVEGRNLSQLRLEQPGKVFDATTLAPWVRQLCEALTYAHEKAGIVHRDLKPANLMIDARGDLKVTDFGISAAISETTARVSKRTSSGFTETYASPQQLRGKRPVVADDIYSLGATLYELLTGKPPFYRGNIVLQVEEESPAPLAERRAELGHSGGSIPKNWEETILACLAKEPNDRPQSAGEVASMLGAGPALATVPSAGGLVTKNSKTAGAFAPNVPTMIRSLQTGSAAAPRKSRAPLYTGLAAVVLALAGLGYYFGIHAPEQRRLAEIARLETQERAAEALKLKNEQERAAAVTARLAAARGGIVVRTNPAGAEVRVGAIALEKSPLTLKDQKLCRYPVRVRLDGYEEWTGETEVKENEFTDLDVALVRSTGTVAISSEPAGLEAEVVGAVASNALTASPRQIVRTPATLKLLTGAYEVRFRRPGWPEQTKAAEVMRNQSTQTTAEFLPGGLELTTVPSGAEVWRNGLRVGVTPYSAGEAVPGRYDFELKLKGYKPAATTLSVVAKQTARASVQLERFFYTVGEASTIPELNLTMVPIPGGHFTMGSTFGEGNEKPATEVTIRRPYWLGRTEVTQGQWEAMMGSNPSNFKGTNRPVEQVSWDDAMAFCRKLTERERAAGRLPEGYVYTLPTEAQWEYACRAGTTGNYAGNLDAMGWYASNSGSTTHPVGQKQANAWGLYDMHGNVWEWCLDGYANYPGGNVTDPAAASPGSNRVDRGGSWSNSADNCRSAGRSWVGQVFRWFDLGFRLALAPSP